MAGPWFTVRESGDGWAHLGDVWLSDGQTDGGARLEYRVRLAGDPWKSETPKG